jgi:hypothetical protein
LEVNCRISITHNTIKVEIWTKDTCVRQKGFFNLLRTGIISRQRFPYVKETQPVVSANCREESKPPYNPRTSKIFGAFMRFCLLLTLTLLTGASAAAKAFPEHCVENDRMYCHNSKTGHCEAVYAADEIATEECNRLANKKIRKTCGSYQGLLFGSKETCDQVLSH